MPLVGGPLCRRMTQAKGRKKIQSSEFPKIKGIHAFAKSAEEVMMGGEGWNGSLPDVRSRARLAGYYAKRVAQICVAREFRGADESLIRLSEFVSPYTYLGLYFMPKEMTRYEDFFGDPLPANLRTGLRGYPSLSLEYLRRFEDNSADLARAQYMMEYQNVAYDGKGSYNSPSYPTDKKGSELPLEVQLTKLVNTFAAVLVRLMKTDGNPDNPEHTNLAAATMVSVSGKDVNPKLTAALLMVLYPQANLDEAMILADLLSHPDKKILEKIPGADLEYAKELLTNPFFRDLERRKIMAELQEKKRMEKKRRRELARLPFADTFEMSFDQLASGSREHETDSWEEDTIPEFDFCKKKAN
jgi:hypothetical protein